MDLRRPHILTFTLPGTTGGEDPVTGFPIPGSDGDVVTVPCRYVSASGKVFKNQDNVEVQQRGRIRVPIGSIMPATFTHLTVTEGDITHFTGPALDVYAGGHLTGWRIDV
ncbi:hypothetical protein [Pedobacter nyackensis]|uniref:Uncharacterized protein n=1 Tax=Pedobacter nyackensis TaxID=475255 RepID=A0A1W1ZXU2_9SPHI|nr:hypothetical protein [Pedobacter nyackensis]SMC53224.1 hypothetical protein SAMN04488101_101139 [Pedobacter nyackensis]